MISGVEGLVNQSADHVFADGRVDSIKKSLEQGQIKKAGEDFEAYFVSYMLKVMRQTVQKSSLTSNRMGDTFQSFYDEAIGKEAAKTGALGLSRYIEANLAQEQVLLSQEGKVAR